MAGRLAEHGDSWVDMKPSGTGFGQAEERRGAMLGAEDWRDAMEATTRRPGPREGKKASA